MATMRLITALMVTMVGLTSMAQAPTPRPRIVVSIMIDGLRDDYLDLLESYFGEDGFRTFMRDGAMIEDVEFGTNLDPAASTSVIYTGSSPSVNGIPAATVYDVDNKVSYPVMLDPKAIGNYTDAAFSPKSIRVSTLSDEVRIDGAGFGNVHSIAPDAAQAIVMAGHAGNSANWINDLTGKWVTASHYRDIPHSIQMANIRRPLASRLDTLVWCPLLAPDKYPDQPTYKKLYAFKYPFSTNDIDRYRRYKTSAAVNTDITDLAADFIRSLRMGNNKAIDMLNIAYTLAPFIGAKDADSRMETMDSYLRLDRDLARLLGVIDSSVGLNNAFIMVAGTPLTQNCKRDDRKWGIPDGVFSPRQAVSLLNVYLMAKYGPGEWVSGYYNGHLYLNRKLIKEQDRNLVALRAEAAEFLVRMSAISQVWTIDDVLASRAGVNAEALRRNTVVDYAGDLIIEVNPGWEIEEIDPTTNKERRSTTRTGTITAPVFLLTPMLTPQRIVTPTDARSIAPTVARLLRIRSPNSVQLPPLRLKKATPPTPGRIFIN